MAAQPSLQQLELLPATPRGRQLVPRGSKAPSGWEELSKRPRRGWERETHPPPINNLDYLRTSSGGQGTVTTLFV